MGTRIDHEKWKLVPSGMSEKEAGQLLFGGRDERKPQDEGKDEGEGEDEPASMCSQAPYWSQSSRIRG